jgi:hypothetical protein
VKYAWLVIGVFAARFFATAIAFPSGDGDLAWQRWLGAVIVRSHAIPRTLGNETFSASGAPWLPQEWLFSLAANAARDGLAWDLFAGAVALCAVAALALGARRAERLGASPRAVALCTALGGIALFDSFGVRAQVVAWPLMALYLLLLDLEGPWGFAAIAVAVVWSNLHASAMLAPIVAAVYAVGAVCRARGFDARARRTTIVAVASLAAICCNPFGWHLPAYAIGLVDNPIKAFINEWRVTDLDDTSFAFGTLPLLVAAMLVCGGRGRTRLADLFVLAAFAFLVLGAARNVALFGIVAFPIVAAALTRSFAAFGAAPERERTANARSKIAFVLPLTAIACALIVGIQLVRHAPPATTLADAPLRTLARMPGPHRLFCADFSWCGLAVGLPNVRVFLDGRADPYPQAVWDDFGTVARVSSAWRATLDRRGIDAMIVSRDTALDQAIADTPGWRAQYRDHDYRLWVREPARNVTARMTVSWAKPFANEAMTDSCALAWPAGTGSVTEVAFGGMSRAASSAPVASTSDTWSAGSWRRICTTTPVAASVTASSAIGEEPSAAEPSPVVVTIVGGDVPSTRTGTAASPRAAPSSVDTTIRKS